MFGLFESKCPVCGMKTKDSKIKRDGKKFCSEEHAQQYQAEKEQLSKKLDKGCCGIKIENEE